MTSRSACCPDFGYATNVHQLFIIDDYGTMRFNHNGMIVKFCPWCATQWDFGMKPVPPAKPDEHGAS